jgi:hypothetical protein
MSLPIISMAQLALLTESSLFVEQSDAESTWAKL